MKKHIIGLTIVAMSIVSCSPLQTALKSDDLEVKKELAEKLFEEGKYSKALRLYEQLEKPMFGQPGAEEMYYNFAEATYNTKDYLLAGDRYKLFAAQYPRSVKKEEALLKEIKCGVHLSPEYSLDQHITYNTIAKLQTFIDQYPGSTFVFEANSIMNDLNRKIEQKAYENARQLNTIGEWTRNYSAAIIALDNFIYDYPGTIFKEDALYYKFDSAYRLAMNSVYSKMEERLKVAEGMYETLIRFNGETKYKEKADRMLENIKEELERISQ